MEETKLSTFSKRITTAGLTCNRMLLKLLLCFMTSVSALPAIRDVNQKSPLPLLLVSFDGFRADYLKKFPMPNLKLLYSQGVLVEELNNVFITKTFPNHYTLVTGLYAESHGIVSSEMYDPISHKHFSILNHSDPMWWRQAEPLWLTALRYGYKTATTMWPGSDVIERTGTHFLPYNRHVTFQQRLGNLTKWILGDGKEQGVMFAALYWEEPDATGHMFGPDNITAMSKALMEVDDNVGLLMSELKRTGLWGRVNMVITSDHGMVQLSTNRIIQLDDCLHPNNYTVVDLSPVAAIIPHADPEVIYSLLCNCHAHMTAYLKKDIPEHLHYKNNERIQQIVLIADEGWTIVQRGNTLRKNGDHGYDNSLPSMHPFMAATGPSFRQGYHLSSLHSVDIYPLMCHLLQIPPQPNNGTLTMARCLLANEVCGESLVVVSFVMGVIFFLLTIFVLYRFMRCHRRSRFRLFQRLRVDDEDISPLID